MDWSSPVVGSRRGHRTICFAGEVGRHGVKIIYTKVLCTKMHKGHIIGHKKYQPEKIKIEGVAFISKKKGPKKDLFSISYFEKCFYM